MKSSYFIVSMMLLPVVLIFTVTNSSQFYSFIFIHFSLIFFELRNKQQQSGLEWHFLRHFVKISLSFQREFTNSQFKIDNEKYYFIVFLFVNGLQQRISETISQIISCVLFCCLQINSIPQLFSVCVIKRNLKIKL